MVLSIEGYYLVFGECILDTASDYRILVVEDALSRLMDIVRYKRLGIPVDWRKAMDVVSRIKSVVYRIKYSYLPLEYLVKSSDLELLMDYSRQLAGILLDRDLLSRFKPDPYMVALTRYCLRMLYGLKYRLMLGSDNNPLYAVDIEGVEVVSVHKHPDADRLYITRAEGILGYTIVTNIQDIKKGEIRAAVILPPAIIRGQLSEAMYCSNPLPREYKKKRPPENLVFKEEVIRHVYAITTKEK